MYAATIVVDILRDDGNGSRLRDAFQSANTDTTEQGCAPGARVDSIEFGASLSGGTTTLSQGQIPIISAPTIQAPAQPPTSVSGGAGIDRLLVVFDGYTHQPLFDVKPSGLILAESAGGALGGWESLVVNDSSLTSNTAASISVDGPNLPPYSVCLVKGNRRAGS